MENLIVSKKVTRNLDGTFYVEWKPINEEIQEIASHGNNFTTKQHITDYEVYAHKELVNCINSYFGQNLYQVNENSIEHSLYIKRQRDGQEAVSALMSELRNTAKLNPNQEIARSINRGIEVAFEKVTLNVQQGWWVTAREQCELVPVEGYVTQALWDRIYSTITNYISENY